MYPPSRVLFPYFRAISLFIKSSLVFLIILMSACGTVVPASSRTIKRPVPTPIDLFAPRVLTVGSYMHYIPQEFADPKTGQSIGFDIDMINALAQRMNLKVTLVNESFPSLLDDLVARQFDVVISAVVITPDSQKKVAFIPYLKSGESLLVSQGNPLHINGISDLCGHTVAAEDNAVEYNELMAANSTCQQQGQQPISLASKNNYSDMIHLLAAKNVDCVYLDLTQADYYMKLYPGQFEIAGSVINPGIEGIAMRLNDTSMQQSFQEAFNQLKTDGVYQTIAQRWGLTSSQLP
jgi:polar amino acid transport system substrate-binding protein